MAKRPSAIDPRRQPPLPFDGHTPAAVAIDPAGAPDDANDDLAPHLGTTDRRALACQRAAAAVARLHLVDDPSLEDDHRAEIQRQSARLYETARVHLGVRTTSSSPQTESYWDSSRRMTCSYLLTSAIAERSIAERSTLRLCLSLQLPNGRLVALTTLIDRLRALTDREREVDPDLARQVVIEEERASLPSDQPIAAPPSHAGALAFLATDLAKAKLQT